ncbi:Mpo1-like protein [Frateuria sp. GZRR33]|uniref:Mpo1-like protein n=1 Tax=Frateuria sp. GZRR33 TaxID=3351535 RepID=UPI003EDC6A7C
MSEFARFRDFYPFYLGEHRNRACRRLHFAGSTLVLLVIAVAIATGEARWLWLAPLAGYGFAWIGHFMFEKNRPATFRHPLYSLAGDWVMYWEILRGRQRM